jgi:hypothetical protein
MAPPFKAARLPLNFDPAGLQADLATLGSREWIAHFNTEFFSGDWSGVALRSPTGTTPQIYADTSHGNFTDTDILQQCEHLRAVVEEFQCPLRSVRLLLLSAGSIIREHRDYDLGYEVGEVRLHVPVITNPGVEFYLDNSRIIMGEGECWYLDLNRPHRVQNLGQTDRVHLVIDCQLNDWLRDLIARGAPESGTESGYAPFHRHVLGDSTLQEELARITERPAFIAQTVALGQAHGFSFLPEDVEAALQAARRHWLESKMA